MQTASKGGKGAAATTAATAPAAPANSLVDVEAPEGEEIDGGDVDEVIKLDPGETVSGVYRGFKVTKSGKAGETSKLHKLHMEDGVARGIWGTLQLDSMLDKIKNGDNVWIAYLGKEEVAGGNTMHRWRVVCTKRAASK